MPVGRERGAGGVAVYDGKIYYAGGLHAGVAVPWFDEYDPATDTWTSLPDMPEARDHFQAAVVGDRFYAIGGRNVGFNATTTVNDAFDMGTQAWITGLAPLPTPRGGFAAASVGNKILVIGGEGFGSAFRTVEAYDTSADSWTALASMPTARSWDRGRRLQWRGLRGRRGYQTGRRRADGGAGGLLPGRSDGMRRILAVNAVSR